MARSQSAGTILQQEILSTSGHLADAPQINGIYYGSVIQTDVSLGLGASSPIPVGMMTINIPTLGVNYLSNPVPYPGSVAPPLGTKVSVGFDVNSNPVVLALYGF
jgi:hypothetical protein